MNEKQQLLSGCIRRQAFCRLTKEERLKYEIAEELGLMEKIKEVGWAGLSPKESGRIGGLISKRKRKR